VEFIDWEQRKLNNCKKKGLRRQLQFNAIAAPVELRDIKGIVAVDENPLE